VLQLQVNGATGSVTPSVQTPQVQGTSPTGLALLPLKNFLYAANSNADTISIYKVNPDGTLTLTGTPIQAGNGPNVAVIDPSGSFLLVTNNFSDNISVYSINSSSGALTQVANSPFPASSNPTDIAFTPSGNFVYVTNPGIGMVTGFSFSNGQLTPIPNTPVKSGAGANALAVYGNDQYLYVANPTAINPAPNTLTTGNISAFNIDPTTGELTPVTGSPFTSSAGSGPSALTITPNGQFLYAVTPGTSFSIWCFAIDALNGQLTATTNSPFSLAGGGLFALFDPTGSYLYTGSDTNIAVYNYSQGTGDIEPVSNSPFALQTAPGRMVFLH